MIVEDEMVIAMDLSLSLTNKDYDVVKHVTRGEDVFRAMQEHTPDLVLMDIKLEGEIDGIEVAQIINEDYNIPVIFLTSYSNKNLIERAKKTNPFGYIVKPYEDKELFTNIELALFKHDAEVKLKESEKKYRELSESIQQIIIECELNGRITYINQPGMQLLGLNYHEISDGISLSSFIEPAELKRLRKRIVNHSHSESQNVNREYRLVNKLGKNYFIEEYLSPIYKEEHVAGFRGILIDITSKRLRDQLNLLFNKLTFLYNTSSVDPLTLLTDILKEFELQFSYLENIYFNEYNEASHSFHKHQDQKITTRKIFRGYSEHVINTKKPLYLRGQELAKFIKQHQIPDVGKKAACWSGFFIKFQNKTLGVFVLKSLTNENALTLSEFDNLCIFFDNVNSLLERISYLREIQRSETQYKLLVNSINDGIIQTDLDGNILFSNKKMNAMSGYSKENLLRMNFRDLITKNKNAALFLEKIQPKNGKWKETRGELKIKSPNGVTKDFLVSGSPVKNENGVVIASMATFIDLSEKKEYLKLIDESEQEFREMAKNVPGVIFKCSRKPDGTLFFYYISKKMTELFGFTFDKSTSYEELAQRIPAEEQEFFFETINKAFLEHSELKYEGKIICGDGQLKWIECIAKPSIIGDEKVFNGIVIDITERKEAVQNILSSEKEKERILRSLPDSFLVLDTGGCIMNSYFKKNERMIGKNAHDLVGKNIKDSLNPKVAETVLAKLLPCLKKERMISEEIEIEISEKKYLFEIRLLPFSKHSALVILRNVTDIRNTIFDLQKFYNITRQSNELIMITDKTGRIEYVNPTFTKITGYELSEIMGKSPSFLKSNKHLNSFYNRLWDTIGSATPFRSVFHNTKKNGELYLEEKTISPLLNDAGEITNFISTGRDVTEELKREKKIITYQKFEKTLEKKEQKYRTLSLIQGQENERKRIAREIHDGLGQMLTVAKANLDSLDDKNLRKKESASKIQLVTDIVHEIIQESRRISHNLSPVGLYEFGLHPILLQFVKRINSNFENVEVKLNSNIENLRFKNEIEINFYRIAQEAVQNALKHARSSKISISIRLDDNFLILDIKDNGIGFDIKQLQNDAKHFNGIKNIEERVKIIDGKLQYLAEKNAGVSIKVTLKAKLLNHDKNILS